MSAQVRLSVVQRKILRISVILRIRIFVNRKILILRNFLRKTTILRKIPRIRLILRIRIFVNTGPGKENFHFSKSHYGYTGIILDKFKEQEIHTQSKGKCWHAVKADSSSLGSVILHKTLHQSAWTLNIHFSFWYCGVLYKTWKREYLVNVLISWSQMKEC